MFQNWVVTSAPSIVNDSFYVAVLLAMLAGGLLFEGGITTIDIMEIDGPLPTACRKDRDIEHAVSAHNTDMMTSWILQNDERVTEALIDLNRCYTSVWLATVFGLLALMIVAVTANGFSR